MNANVPRTRWIVSVDLGQSIDPTAIAVLETVSEVERARAAAITPYDVEQADLNAARDRARIDVRHLERLPLHTDYVAVVQRVAALLCRPPLDLVRPDLVVDQTGVGRPVVDLFRRAQLDPVAVTITAGDTVTKVEAREFRVAKLLLVSRLQAALHAGDLRIAARLAEAKTLVGELEDFRANITDAGYARFGARVGRHDDLVLAVALGAWWAAEAEANTPTVSFSHVSM